MMRQHDPGSVVCLEASAWQLEDLHTSHGDPAPHLRFERNGRQVCTCELFGEHFVLLVGVADVAWRDAALGVANRLGIQLVARRIGPGGDLVELDGRWPSAYGIRSRGAVLMRPDGSVCWRAEECATHPEQTLDAVLADVAAAYAEDTRSTLRQE